MNRSRQTWISLVGFLWFSSFISVRLSADELLGSRKLPAGWRVEAELRDMYFWDLNLGWAVGDQGTILTTNDGGKSWRECKSMRSISNSQVKLTSEMKAIVGLAREATGQSGPSQVEHVASPISATLESVYFIDELRGWAAGGYSVPYVDRSRAIILKTNDGGATWIPQANQVAPRLHQVCFQDQRNGIALSEGGNLFKSGLLTTSDGGLNWMTRANLGKLGWIVGQFSPDGFVGVDSNGTIRSVRGDRMETAVIRLRPAPPIRDLIMQNEKTGWAVGDQGTLLKTEDGGASWFMPPIIQQATALRGFDLKTVTIAGSRIWFAGNPGNYLFCFDTQTGEFFASRTQSSAGINCLVFVGDQGWACGQMGTIHATVDQGANWQLQRGGNAEAAVLVLNWDDQVEGLDAVARFGADEGLRVLTARVNTDSASHDTELECRDACLRIGSLANLQYDAFSADTQNPNWEQFELQLVRWIRQYRPRSIVSSCSLLRHSNGAVIDLNEILNRAIKAAGQANFDQDHLEATGQSSWMVSQLLLCQKSGGSWAMSDNTFLPNTGSLLGDYVAVSRALCGAKLLRKDPIGFEIITGQSGLNVTEQGGLSDSFRRVGVSLPQRSDKSPARGSLREVQAAMGKANQINTLLGMSVQTKGDEIVWMQALSRLLNNSDEESAGAWLAQLAEGYLERGNMRMAEMALDQLLERVPRHGLGPAALIWSAHAAVSREAQLAIEEPLASAAKQNSSNSKVKAAGYESQVKLVEENGMKKMVWAPKTEEGEINQQASATDFSELEPTTVSNQEFWKEASRRLARVRQRDPDLGALPSIRWLEARAALWLTGWDNSQKMFSQLVEDRTVPADIREASEAELERYRTAREPDLLCAQTTSIPKLDGILDDPVWQACRSRGLVVTNASTSGGEVMMAHDDENLFIAIRCTKLPGVAYRPKTSPRTRNEDLRSQDRVTVSWDIDSDGFWPLSVSIDSRGCVRDECGSTPAWDPQWFCAQNIDEATWTAEAAIPLNQFGTARPVPGDTWHCRMARYAPWETRNLWNEGLPGSAALRAPLEVALTDSILAILKFE